MVNKVLWDTADLARFFKRSTQWVRANSSKLNNFPQPIIPGRWHPDAIAKWAQGQSNQTPEHQPEQKTVDWEEKLRVRLPKKKPQNSVVYFPKNETRFTSD